MMEGEFDLSQFGGLCRLFPLPGVVHFPHTILPLHIFEPRYRQMTEDALATDRLVAIVQALPSPDPAGEAEPTIEEVACLGRILNYNRLPDGRFHFLLLGLRRVRLVREVADSTKLYRLAEALLLEDEPAIGAALARRGDLLDLFRTLVHRENVLDADLNALLEADPPLGMLTDLIAHALGLPPDVKQSYLEECRVERRAERLIDLLRHWLGPDSSLPPAPPGFPPPFSSN